MTGSMEIPALVNCVANALCLSEMVSRAATRLYTLAVERKFTKVGKSIDVIAVCLYIVYWPKKDEYMRIDSPISCKPTRKYIPLTR